MKKLILSITIALSTAVAPETATAAHVKHIGEIDLDTYDCRYTKGDRVRRICYGHKKEYNIIVLLGDTYYGYSDVPRYLFDQWIAAPSKTLYYKQHIKGQYQYR